MTIGEKIRYYREALSITQDDLAEALKTTPQNIYKYEKGIITNIPLSTLELLAEQFKISVRELVGWEEDSLVFDDNEPNLAKRATALGSNIKKRRLELGIDEITFALEIGIVIEKIRDYENGDFNNMETELLDLIAEVLKTTSVDLMTYTDTSDDLILTEEEKELIRAYREHAEHHYIIKRMLNLSPSETPKDFQYPPLTSDDIAAMQPIARVASRRLKYGAKPGEDPYEDVSKSKLNNND